MHETRLCICNLCTSAEYLYDQVYAVNRCEKSHLDLPDLLLLCQKLSILRVIQTVLEICVYLQYLLESHDLRLAVVDAVDIPVIAAGGIGDGRGVCAAFMLGAEAVQMGTRFVVAKESNVHQNYKDRVIAAKDIDSVVTGRSTGHPVRSLRNSMTREYLDMEKEGVEFEKLERLTLGTLRKAVVDGDVKQGTVMAGQIAGLVNKEQTCEEIIKELMKEVSEVYNSHNKLA